MFDTTKLRLGEILEKATQGRIQLPEFQRDYVWNDEDVMNLIASIARGYPIGAILTLEYGGEISFKPRLLEGCKAEKDIEEFLLDGQQRITSLNQSLNSDKPVITMKNKDKEKTVKRFYYLDIKKAVSDVDMEDAVTGVPEDKVIRTKFGRDISMDLSTEELEFANKMFPLNKALYPHDWLHRWRDYAHKKQEDIDALQKRFRDNIIDKFDKYQVPIIRLSKDNDRAAICQTFEKINVGGKKLDAFELVTAIYAGDNFDLRENWKNREKEIKNKYQVLSKIGSTEFLQACTVLHTREVSSTVSCKRDALLRLPLYAYQRHADTVVAGFHETGRFLTDRQISRPENIPYPPQVVTLASVFAVLGSDGLNDAIKRKLDRWFWCTTFGELYGSSSETRIAMDVHDLVEWCRSNDTEPRSVSEAYFQKQRLDSLRTKRPAAFKGLHALLMAKGCRDFVNGSPASSEEKLDIHHIFPKDWCKKNGIENNVFESITNKTPISKRTNIRLSGAAPSVYLKRIEEKDNIEPQELNKILETHMIDPTLVRGDKFADFIEARATALAMLIGNAMQKPVVDEKETNEPEEDNMDVE